MAISERKQTAGLICYGEKPSMFDDLVQLTRGATRSLFMVTVLIWRMQATVK